MKDKVKELRKQIDGYAQLAKELKGSHIETFPYGDLMPGTSKEVYKAVDSLLLAKAWLGKVLGALGTESPYPKDGTRKTVEDIEPTADTNNGILHNPSEEEIPWKEKSHIEKVDWLRQEIEVVLEEIRFRLDVDLGGTTYSRTFLNNVTTHLSESRFWLGFELSRCRDEK